MVIATVQVGQEFTDITMEALNSPNTRKILRQKLQQNYYKQDLTELKMDVRLKNIYVLNKPQICHQMCLVGIKLSLNQKIEEGKNKLCQTSTKL